MAVRNGNGNNRILPTNTRAVDVARRSVDLISAVQNRRYDNAFQVQGFDAILYGRKKGGLQCLCHAKDKTLGEANSVLDIYGNAKPGVINALLTGQQFGVQPYGATNTRKIFNAVTVDINSTEVNPPAPTFKAQAGVSIFDDFEPSISKPMHGTPGQGFALDGDETANTTVLIEDGFSDAGPVSGEGTEARELLDRSLGSGIDFGFGLTSDVACPICFGTGYVGGFNIHGGYRLVLDSQQLAGGYDVDYQDATPRITGSRITFAPQIFPRGALSVDSLVAFNGSKIVPVSTFFVDNTALTTESKLLLFCDGKEHTVSLEMPKTVGSDGTPLASTITHVEIQYNQSTKSTKFEFPKISQSAVESLIERTDPFQIILSPAIPNIGNGDIITDSTYGKTFIVSSANWWNDKRRAVLGWECEVRPCQPQELYTMLPRRRISAQSQNNPSFARANTNARF